jgi:hypothetical protein
LEINGWIKDVRKWFHFFLEKPCSSIPEACVDWANTKAVYRFYSNEKVKATSIMEGHLLKVLERTEKYQIILKAQDTTDLDYTNHKSKKDTGYLKRYSNGLSVHSTIAISPDGIPLGIINQQVWARDNEQKGKAEKRYEKNIEQKESYRWLESLKETEKLFENTKLQVMIADRESDIYDLFTLSRRKNSHFLIRAGQNRLLQHVDRKLFTAIEKSNSKGKFTIEVGRKKGQSSRIAELDVKYERLIIKAPKNTSKEIKTVELNVILVEETNPPDGIEAIKWILLTTLEINSLEDALTYVRWYSYRWLIERYHYVLKSGCNIEQLQLEDNTEKAVAFYSIIACLLLRMTYQARIETQVSCEEILTKNEWQSLYVLVHKKADFPKEIPTMKEAIRWLARLGGFLARKSDGEPGVKTLWRGCRTFYDIIEGVNLLNNISNPLLHTYG